MPAQNTTRPRSNTAEDFWQRANKTESCWLWSGSPGVYGYGQFVMAGVHWRPNRLAWTLVNGPIPEGMKVCHSCDTPACVNPDHLFLGTQADNVRDMFEKGRNYHKTKPEALARGERHGSRRHPEALLRGEDHPASKLDAAKVRAIRDRWAEGAITQAELAVMFGISPSVISAVVRRRTWRHV